MKQTGSIGTGRWIGMVMIALAGLTFGSTNTHAEQIPVGHPTFVSPHARPIAINGDRVYVVNTPADTVDVIDRKTRKIVSRVDVGVDPVSIGVRPDGKEVWVANHVSDSVSVIDTDPASPTHLRVVATIQEFDPRTRATRFDEPVGIAFANDSKAYVALSSDNQIAVIDVASRKITKRLAIPAQDPRAIVVRNGRLYVVPFESNNKTQLSGGSKIDGDLVTFNAWDHSIRVNNVLSVGHVVDIVKHPRVPDRDLFVYDTKTDKLVRTIDTLGTLLYGMTVDSKGRVFIAQADARNDVNGRSGTKKHGLKEMENRAFLNQITRVSTTDQTKPTFYDLEPLPPKHPAEGQALATPFAIQVSDDDSTLVATAAGSDKLFTVDSNSGKVLGRVDVGAVPRGIALESASSGKPAQAWVFNAVENSVSLVDLQNPGKPSVTTTIAMQDPTHPKVKRGRIAFNTASASTTGTFSCASCHPDGHTDQLLWVLKTPIVTGGNQIMPRSTMPIRGLRDTEPYHWDGIPGDPYGGINSASVRSHVEPNSKKGDAISAARHLIDGGLGATMHMEGDKGVNDAGQSGRLTAKQRDDMAAFILSVPYPPAQRRAYDNVVSNDAKDGFRLFHIEGDLDPSKIRRNICGDCHRMPFLVSTNTPGSGMDAPTWRGAYDRFLILPQGRLNIIDFDFYRTVAERGQPERNIWQFSWAGRERFNPIWDMVLEGSTGHAGAFARQVTLSQDTAKTSQNGELLGALETAAREGGVVLEGDGVLIKKGKATPIAVQFDGAKKGGVYLGKGNSKRSFTRSDLVAMAERGEIVLTLTAHHGANDDFDHPQPGIWTQGPIEKQRGRQRFPVLHSGKHAMTVSGRHLRDGATIYVDGRRASGSVALGKDEQVVIELASLPSVGIHLIQLQNPGGMFTNDFIFHVAESGEAAAQIDRDLDREYRQPWRGLNAAVTSGNVERVRRAIGDGSQANDRLEDGSTLLSAAVLRGHLEVARLLIEKGAKVDAANRDGNTPLHIATFLCREDVVRLLLKHGAPPMKKNGRGETSIDVVSGEWSDGLGAFYKGIGDSVGFKVDLGRIQRDRPKMAEMLRKHLAN